MVFGSVEEHACGKPALYRKPPPSHPQPMTHSLLLHFTLCTTPLVSHAPPPPPRHGALQAHGSRAGSHPRHCAPHQPLPAQRALHRGGLQLCGGPHHPGQPCAAPGHGEGGAPLAVCCGQQNTLAVVRSAPLAVCCGQQNTPEGNCTLEDAPPPGCPIQSCCTLAWLPAG
jgi:hypothetical protein